MPKSAWGKMSLKHKYLRYKKAAGHYYIVFHNALCYAVKNEFCLFYILNYIFSHESHSYWCQLCFCVFLSDLLVLSHCLNIFLKVIGGKCYFHIFSTTDNSSDMNSITASLLQIPFCGKIKGQEPLEQNYIMVFFKENCKKRSHTIKQIPHNHRIMNHRITEDDEKVLLTFSIRRRVIEY